MKKVPINVRHTAAAGMLWSIVFTVYRMTMSPSVGFIDSGELAAVSSTLGIAHPTGYPLFTLAGRIFSMIPVAEEVIVRLNLMSAVFSASAIVVLFFVALQLLEPMNARRTGTQIISAMMAVLFFAFAPTVWRQAVIVEVYSLHLLLVGFATLFFLKALHADLNRWWWLFAYVLGLAFTNHMTTILLAPAFLFLFFKEHGIGRTAFVRCAYCAIPFGLGLSVYAFLPLRAMNHPILNWGNPQTPENFIGHISGKQFRVWMFSSVDIAKKQFNYFLDRLPIEFMHVLLAIALVGAIVMAMTAGKRFVFVILLLITCVGYSINYDIHDIDAYFLLAYAAIMLFVAFGLDRLFRSASTIVARSAVIGGCILLIGYHVWTTWNSVDQSKNYYVEDYTTGILEQLPPHSIILSYQWDYFISASYYYQHVKGVRQDIVILDKELFRRSWYYPQLEKIYPGVMQRSREEIDRFLPELQKFERGLPYEYATIEGRYAQMLKSFIDRNIDEFPIFVTHEIEEQYTTGYYRIPFGLVYRLTRDQSYVESPYPTLKIRSHAFSDTYIAQLRKISSQSLYQRGLYEQVHHRDSAALQYFGLSRKVTE
jgi:hypothetical protein